MSESAARQRAAARREAILNARGNRLSKLTSSARGDAAPGLYDDVPSPIRSSPAAAELLGEEPTQNMPIPRATATPSPSPGSRRTSRLMQSSSRASVGPDDFALPAGGGIPQEQQEAMMRALLASMGGAAATPGLPSLAPGLTPPGINTPTGNNALPAGDPFAAMLAQMADPNAAGSGPGNNPLAAAFGAGGFGGGANVAVEPPKPKTLFQKLTPLIHIVSVLVLLAYFVFTWEPAVHEASGGIGGGGWARWSGLVGARSSDVQAVPIFAAFTTLQIVLHSIRIYNEPTAARGPTGILGMVLPHLPPPLPNVISTGMKYFKMGGAVMDDVSVLVFAVGVIVWGAGLASS